MEPDFDPPPLDFEGPGRFYNRKAIDARDWEAAQSQEATLSGHQVLVSGMPNNLLSDMMIDAILQQSGMSDDAIKGFKASPGNHPSGPKADGQLLITLTSADWARCCACHFHGRAWGSAVVSAEVLPTWESETEAQLPAWEWPAHAPEFVPYNTQPHYAQHRIQEPIRVEAASAKSWLEDATSCMRKEKSGSRSDASTRDEESESGDEVSKLGSVAVLSP